MHCPLPKIFFDVIVAVDSYGYFGTDDLYLSYITSFLKSGGIIAAVLPGLMQDFDNFEVPKHLLKPQKNGNIFWEPDCFTFHTKDWWLSHWMKTTLVEVETYDTLEDGYKHWAIQEKALELAGFNIFPSVEETLLNDAGQYIGFVRIIATKNKAKTEESMPHAWQPEFSAVCDSLRNERDSRKKDAQPVTGRGRVQRSRLFQALRRGPSVQPCKITFNKSNTPNFIGDLNRDKH